MLHPYKIGRVTINPELKVRMAASRNNSDIVTKTVTKEGNSDGSRPFVTIQNEGEDKKSGKNQEKMPIEANNAVTLVTEYKSSNSHRDKRDSDKGTYGYIFLRELF